MSDPSPNPESVFAQMIEIDSPEKRAAFLEQACGHDPDLRREMEKLVSDHFKAGRFLESPAARCLATIEQPSAERPGTTIGPYKLMEQIGEGGMGLVFVAEQRQPVRRKVALKIIKPGMDSRQVIARFEAERQALAMMDHPNIAKVHDGGTTPTGRPYFVMELVRGVPITEYCDDNRLKPRERLELFGHVCAAVQHAHQKGIIHRDIKPSNVLVVSHDGTPVVKVIDFGVAKAMGQQLTDKTVYTDFLQFIGTPLYMSPEQAGQSGLDVDTRTDVYALGVLLYELLTGTTPFDKDRLHKAGYEEIRRLIREEEPPKPSTRISTLGQAGTTVSAQRQSDSKQLCKMLRGELDWIVMKALEKDRNRRYESASALAADVQRYLQDEHVQACPPSALYRLRKFTRRHRARLGVAAILGIAVLLGGAAFLWRQGQRSATAQAVENDLKEAGIYRDQQQWTKAVNSLERAQGRLEGSGLTELANRVEQQRREVRLVDQIEKARMQMLQVAGREDRDFAGADRLYAAAFAENGMDLAALPPQKAARRIEASPIHVHLVRALDSWAYCKDHLAKGGGNLLRSIAQAADKGPWRQQLRDPALRKNRAALEKLAENKAVLDQPPELLLILFGLLEDANVKAAGIRLLIKAQPIHPEDFWINYQLANSLGLPATATEAVGYGRAALAVRPESAVVYLTLANAVGNQGVQWEPEAEALLHKAMALEPGNPHVYIHLGNNQRNQKKFPEAEAAFRKAIELKPDDAISYSNLGALLLERNKLPGAEAACRKAIELEPDFDGAYSNLSSVLRYQGKFPEAEAAARKAIEINPTDDMAYTNLGGALIGQGRLPESEAALRKAVEVDPKNGRWHRNLSAILERQNKLPEAEAACRKAIELDPKNADVYSTLGYILARRQKSAEALAAARKAVDLNPLKSHYDAACIAALAGCASGKDAATEDTMERARYRGQALKWLRAALAVERAGLIKVPDQARSIQERRIRHWQEDTDFNGVRGDEALAKLPEAERREWRKLWEEVEELRKRAGEGKPR